VTSGGDGGDGSVLCLGVLFVFFQAEDGIRDWSVTGVQTCALPISITAGRPPSAVVICVSKLSAANRSRTASALRCTSAARSGSRSEERRVGKECRCRGWPYH